jgi:hypothetical protein
MRIGAMAVSELRTMVALLHQGRVFPHLELIGLAGVDEKTGHRFEGQEAKKRDEGKQQEVLEKRRHDRLLSVFMVEENDGSGRFIPGKYFEVTQP